MSDFDDFDLNIDEEALERANAERMAEQNEEAKALTEGDAVSYTHLTLPTTNRV